MFTGESESREAAGLILEGHPVDIAAGEGLTGREEDRNLRKGLRVCDVDADVGEGISRLPKPNRVAVREGGGRSHVYRAIRKSLRIGHVNCDVCEGLGFLSVDLKAVRWCWCES